MSNKKISKNAKRQMDEAEAFIDGELWGHASNTTEEAIESYLHVLKINPQRIDVHYNLGKVYLQHAQRFFEKVVAFNPDDAAAHYYSAGIDTLLSHWAERDYLRAIEINPDYVEAYYDLSNYYRHNREHKKADEYLQKGLEVERQLTKTCRNLPKMPIKTLHNPADTADSAVRSLLDAGMKHQKEHNYTQAVKCFQQAIAAEPDRAEAYYRLALSLAERNHYDSQSLVYLLKAAQLNPNHTGAWLKLAEKVRREYSNDATYLQYLERVVSIDPPANKYVIGEMMQVYRHLEKSDELLACYRRLVDMEPDNISVLDDLANEYRRQGKPDEAMACYRTIVEKNPENARAYAKIGFICYEQNDEPQAVAWFEKAAAAGSARARQWLTSDEATRRGVVKFADLLKRHTWDEVNPVFIAAYPDYAKMGYGAVYARLLTLEPVERAMRIVIEPVHNDEENYHDVSGCKTQPATKKEATTRYGLEYTDWAEWLGMDIDHNTLEDYLEEEIIANCFWEMTFCGTSPEMVKAKADKLFNNDHEAERREEMEAFPKIGDGDGVK
ncbi:hypothetical protein FACS1894162_2030 [Bacteroidia bacterium]|nr:hypothetical protein FACS1894162_2030 [Bacteroidia bacterium]